ncbi:AGAP008117-PA-like protein [Anopheles sinensis]|uniref:AGAP008117-PA-like protein n=1 Tax=Anopheles sinensis TaxID=74873 RepID=A0A084W8A3_ANOSI|nr:AGAP008117-PA-like protein [Anopheles sinensis]
MAASERVKRFSSIFRNDRQWQVLVIGWIFVCLLFPATVKAQIDCYYCAKECDSVIADQITPCGDECGIWYTTADDKVQVGRGCIESFPGTAVEYQRCTDNICNDAIPKRCLQCASVDSSECQEVLCSGTEDKCYLNPADGHRGCTSDQSYETDCRPEAGDDRCSLCSSPVGRSCNENIRCVVCDESAGEQCMQVPDATVQSCPSSSDQCYRYLDADRMLHMGCTSSEDYRFNCGESDNCHTCTGDECNRDVVADALRLIRICLRQSNALSLRQISVTLDTIVSIRYPKLRITNNLSLKPFLYQSLHEGMERETVRGCASPEALELDAVELCDVPGCNDADFPTHLQCYQCVGCDQIAWNDVNFCQSVSATGCFMLLTEPEEGLRTLIRGCNTDEAYSECREDQNCVTCSGDACNGGPKTGRILCARCSGLCRYFFYNRCYMYSDVDGTLMKGCLLELEPDSELASVCYDPADSRCQYCTGDSCNRQHCISCDTRTDGLDCILGLTSGNLRYEMCASNSDVCRTVVDVEGHTVRGCVNPSVEPCDSTVACSDTVTPGSNKDVFPPERLRCYKCNGEEWCGEEQDEGTAQYCTLYYGTDDGCYTYQDGTTVVRGCTADPDARCKTDEDPFCKVASESLSNGEFQNMISCYQDCPGGTGSDLCTPAVACIPPNDRCFLSVSTTGVISRGCTTAFQGCPLDSRDCYVCVESNCNGAFGVCANCDTELGEDCTVPEEHGKVCENGMASCFHYVDREKEIFGCAEPVQEFCEDDADHCQICTGALCNLKALTVCLSCTGCEDVDGDVEPDSQICADEDTCFTGLVGTRVDRGCRSAMPDPIEFYQELESCSSPMFCNDISRAAWVRCYVCSDCPDVPPTDSSQLCQNPLSNRCFTLRDVAGQVHRGCVGSALPEGCVEGLNCTICTGEDYCNDQAASGAPTPESPAFSCVRCEGETCSEYNAISACPNEVGLLFEGCVTYDAGDGSVRKGCLSESALWELCSADPTSCKVSDVPNGNARQIRCFTCERLMECIEKQEQQESSLVVYDSGACVVFFDSVQETPTGLVAYDIIRGNSNEGCANKNPELCFECYTDGCNGELFPRDRLQCVQCRGEECAQLSTSESIPLKPCQIYSATNAQCYTRFEGELFAERGCQGDTDVCLDPDDTKCRLCEGNGCNDLEYGLLYESVTCQTCSSNAQCETDPTVTTCSDKTRGCYSYFSGPFVVAKGCVSDITPTSSFYDDCTVVGGTERCQRCGGDNCNSHLCFECDSNEDEDCFEPRVGGVRTVSCPSPECIAFVDSNAQIIRGCSSNYETPYACSAQLETCLQCEGDYCNAGPIPRNRIKCHQCAGSGVDCLSPAIGDAKYCPIYNYEEERCYTYFADENTVRRGCVTEENPECNEEYCKQCNTSACNDQRPLIPNTLRCVQCDSVERCREMENVGPQPCLGYHLFGRPEQCYTVFDESNAVSRRGCLSQLPETEANRCRNGADFNCKACSSDGCNAQSVECVVCDSNTNPACGGNALSGSFERNRCGTGRCVSLVTDWITWKGCWEDFEEDCAAPENAGIKCDIFEGKLSNTGIFPEDRLKCYHCEGPRDTCGQIGSGTTLEVCQRYHPLDECYTYVSDSGYTIRGCSTTIAQECNENPVAHCPRCQGEGCNAVPFEQPNWLTCAKCAHATECAERKDNPVFELCTRKLLLGRHDDCYTYSFGGEVLERGCLSEADPTIQAQCVDGSSECSVCHCDRCNGPPTSCVVCQGERGCGDAGNTDLLQACTTGTCVITSFVWNSDGVLMIAKQCSETVQLDTCSKGPPGGDYQVCHSPGCNDVLYPPGRIRCYQCEGASCADPSLLPTVCDPYIEGMDACYSFFDRQQKGCIGQLNQTQRDECQSEGTVCRTCSSGDGCNLEPRALECTVCSSESDPDCGSRPIGSTARTRKSCSTGGCATYIDDNGFTVKGCAVDFQLTEASCSDENDALCYFCSTGDGCNDELLFPPDRQECFQCSGAACVDVTLNSPTTCRRYNASTDGCYTYAIDRDNIERGCLNERPSCAEEAACVTCTSPNTGCNTEPAIVPNDHSCYQCDGADCAPKRTGPGTACSGELLLGRTDSCYTFVDTYTVRRGCYSDEDACDPANPSCHVCAPEKDCNADEYTVTSNECIQCFEGTDGEACLWGYRSTDATRCTEPESSPSSSRTGCYRCYDNEDEAADYPLFRRGCVGDAGERRCHNDPGYSVCLGAGCNNRNERIQICAKCGTDDGCDRWIVEECRGTVPYERRGCYVMRDVRKRILGRGCVAQLNESDWERCQDVRDGSCTMCFGNQCNGATTAMLGGHLTGLLAGTVVLTIRLLVSFNG